MGFLDGRLFCLLLVGLSCTAAVRAVELPSLQTILTKLAEDIEGTYTLTGSCRAVLTSEEDGCVAKITGQPSTCMSLQVIATKLLGNNSNTIRSIVSAAPSSVVVKQAKVDICDEVLQITVTSTRSYQVVPNVVSVSDLTLTVKLLIPTSAIRVQISGNWQIGSIKFSIMAMKNDERIAVEGNPIPASKQFNIGQIVTSLSRKFIPGNTVQSAVSAVGLNSIRLRNVVLKSAFLDRGFGVRLAFTAISNTLGNPRIYLTLNSVKGQTTSRKGVSIAAEFKNLRLSTLFNRIAKIDISGVPFIGSTTFKSLVMVSSTMDLGEPLIPYDSDTMMQLSPVVKGIKLLTEIKMSSNSNAVKVRITISNKIVNFEILGDSGISVSAFIDRIISSMGRVVLPPGFHLQSFLNLNLRGFTYDATAKLFTLSVVLPDAVVVVPKAIELENATIVFQVSRANGTKFGFQVKSVWRLGNLDIPLTIGKPVNLQYFVAESRPTVDIPFGSLMKKFLLSFLPRGGLRDAAKKVGLDSFYITKSYLKLIFAREKVLKIAGTATIGAWDKCQVEVMLGQVGGSFVMATGIVLLNVPITTIVYKMTDKRINLKRLPGSSILDATDVAISMASQNVPKTQQLMQFDIPALGDVEILDGVTLVTSFKFPPNCKDRGCLTFKRLLGPDAQLVLKGRLFLASVYVSATVPTTIQIYRGINITDVGLEVEMGVQRNAIGIKGTLKIPRPALTFIGGFGISNSGVYLQMSMAGMWNKPFGIPFFSIGNLHIRAAIVPDPVVLSAIEFGGQGKLGLIGNSRAKPIHASMYVGIDRVAPFENFFQGSFSALTIKDLLAAFAYYPRLPKALETIGFPRGMNTSFALKSKILPNGITVPRGYFLKGMLKILFLEAYADVKINLNGIFMNLTLKPFNIGKGLVSVSGRSSTMGPRILVDIGWNPPRAFINIEGRLRVLGITSYTNITIDHRGMSFEVSGSFLNLFEAGLKITTSYASINTADFTVAGYFRQTLLSKLQAEVGKALNNYKNNAARAIANAKRAVSNAQKKFDDAANKVRSAQNDVNSKKRHFDDVNRKLDAAKKNLQSKKRNWDSAVARVRSARNSVTNAQRKFDSAIRSLRDKQRKSCPNCRKRRAADTDTFVDEAGAKQFVKNTRVKRGWFIRRVRIKNPIEAGREAVEKTRELAEKGKEKVRCAAIKTARAICIKALQAAELAVRGARSSLDVAKGVLRGAEAAVSQSKRIMDVAAFGVTIAQRVVDGAKRSLDLANLALRAAAEIVSKSKHTLDVAKLTLSGVNEANKFGVMIGDKLAKLTLGGIIDIQELRFSTRLSIAQTGHFRGYMRARIFGRTKTFSIDIKLRSIKDMVKVLVNKVKEGLGIRGKRSVDDQLLRILKVQHLIKNKREEKLLMK